MYSKRIWCVLLVCCFSTCISKRTIIPGYDHTNEGNEFFVGFIRNRFGRTNEQEMVPPVLWITTKESTPVNFEVFTFFGNLTSGIATPGQVTYVNIPLGFVVFDSSEDTETDSRFKGIRIKAQNDRRIVVFGHHEEVASTDTYLALPIILLPAGRYYEYIAASIQGDFGTVTRATDSVALIIGTENDTELILEPSVPITHPFAPAATGGQFIPGASVQFRTVTIQKFQTFYLQVRGGDISGTRIIANKPISVFSGHECANIPLNSEPCDILIEQLQPIDTWGTEAVTIPLRTRSGDVLKVFASRDSTTVNVTYTDVNISMVTNESFTLDRNGFKELGGVSSVATGAIDDFALIQSNNPIAVYQFSRSHRTDNNILSDPFMMSVPTCEQYRDSYAVAPAPFNETIEGTVSGRVAYINYTNIAVPAEYFNASLITVNNNTINASEFKPIRRADNSIWGYGAQLLLNEGAQVIRHQDPNAALSVTLYGFSNQQSWGCIGGTGLAPVALLEPTILLPDNNSVFTVNETDSYSLTCNATGVPAPMTFIWLKDGAIQNYTVGTDRISISGISTAVPYSTNNGDILSVSQVLTISSAVDEDSGTYACVVSNGIGSNASVTVQLIVQGPPCIIEGPTNTTEIDDSNVTLTCGAVASPQHDITWMFQRTGTNATIMIISTSSPDPNMKYLVNDNINTPGFGTLTITDLHYSDGGIYTCIAANTHGSVSDDAMVNVYVSPFNQTISGGGRFNISSEVNLTCTVIGVPLPAVMWQFNGNNIDLPTDCVLDSYNASSQMISTATDCLFVQSLNLLDSVIAEEVTDPQDIISLGAYELSDLIVESTLTISSLQRNDNGSYTCNITNMLPEIGNTSVVTDFTIVIVLERPDPIENVTVVAQGSRWALLMWNAPYNGNSEIMGYIVYINNVDSNSGFVQVNTSSVKRQTMSSQFTTTSTSYNVTENILPFTRYQFSVVACNELDCGALGQPSPDIQTNSEPPETAPLNCVAMSINSTAIIITWSPPVMPNGIIMDYTVSYVPGQSLSTANYSNDGNVSVAIGYNSNTTVLSGLRVATKYFVAIAAHTTVGIGPFSSSLDCTAQTMEDVPRGSPLEVTLFSPTSTSIHANWDLPNPLLRNGIITKHRLIYTAASQSSSWTTIELNASTSHVIEQLKIFTQYYVSVSAGTEITGYGPFSPPVIYRTLYDVPSAPRNPQVIAIDKTALPLQWMEPEILNGIILYYRIYYKLNKSYLEVADEDFDTSTKYIDTPDNSTNFTITGLIPAVNYTVYLSAFTEAGEGDISVKITSFTSFDEINTALFQIRLKPIENCDEWTENDRKQKQDDIKAEIVQEVVKRCLCEFTTNNIINGSFSCRGSQGQFKDTVVYRGRIALQVPPPIIDADDIIITEMSEWVQTEPSVIVTGVTLYLDPSCPVLLDSFDSPDCVTDTPPDQAIQPSSSSSSSSVGIIVGVVVAVVVIITILIIVVLNIVMYRKRKSAYSVNMLQKQRQTNEYVITNSLTTGMPDHPVGGVSNSNITKQADNLGNIKSSEDIGYDIIKLSQTNTDNIEMYTNPSYTETKFT